MHGQYLSAGWPLDRRDSARAHGGTAGGPTRDSEAAARNRRAPVRQHQAMDEPGHLSPAWTGEGAGRIQPDGAGLQFHPCGEHCGRREPPQSGVKEGGRLPQVTSRPRGAGDRSCGTSQMATALRDLIPSNANSPERFHTVWKVIETAKGFAVDNNCIVLIYWKCGNKRSNRSLSSPRPGAPSSGVPASGERGAPWSTSRRDRRSGGNPFINTIAPLSNSRTGTFAALLACQTADLLRGRY